MLEVVSYLDRTEAAILLDAADQPAAPSPLELAYRSLPCVLEEAAPDLRKALVAAALGRRAPRFGRSRLGPHVVETRDNGGEWRVERRGGQLYRVAGQRAERVEGQGALPLLSHLSGASIGALSVTALRLLGLDLSVEELTAIRAFINARLLARLEKPGEAGTTAPAADFGGPRE